MKKFRQLQKGETILATDELLEEDEETGMVIWVPAPAHMVGMPASAPQYIAHAQYRRDCSDDLHYPYKVEIMHTGVDGKVVWWPVSASSVDNMVIGDGITGDKTTAEHQARCCNIAYRHAIEDLSWRLRRVGVDITPIVGDMGVL